MEKRNNVRKWQRGETKLAAAIESLVMQYNAMLAKADKVRDRGEKKKMWQHAQRIEDRINTLRRRLFRLQARALEAKQPSLFDM